jgi:hypothetical protein
MSCYAGPSAEQLWRVFLVYQPFHSSQQLAAPHPYCIAYDLLTATVLLLLLLIGPAAGAQACCRHGLRITHLGHD